MMIHISAEQTYAWAHRPGAAWPGSYLSGRQLDVEVAGDLLGLAIDDGAAPEDCPMEELSACLEDICGRL